MGRHAIVVIKKDNKYLQYFEERWNSYLFLNTKTTSDTTCEDISEFVKNKFNVDHDIDVSYIDTITHTKFSVSHNEMREYTHDFYLVNNYYVDEDDNYKYFSMEELENNKRIMEVNSDVVSYIKKFNI